MHFLRVFISHAHPYFSFFYSYCIDATSSYLRKFEEEVANDFGKEDAVFMPSGRMAQNIALLIHSQKEKHHGDTAIDFRFACHHTSHLLLWEEESYNKLCGFQAVEINTKSACKDGIHIPPMRRNDVQSVFMKEKRKYNCDENLTLGDTGLSTLIIELPHRELGGALTPWEDVVSIGELCSKNNVAFHCDGARIFEASAGYDKELSAIAQPFDSVYISFYKGLGAISGAMLMGDKDFCKQARVWLTRFGGNLFSSMPYAVSCWMGYRLHASRREPFPDLAFSDKLCKLRRCVDRIGADENFCNIGSFTPGIPETNMVHVYLKRSVDCCVVARDKVCSESGLKVFSRIREVPPNDPRYSSGFRSCLEWTMGNANGLIGDDDFIKAWGLFSSYLTDQD